VLENKGVCGAGCVGISDCDNCDDREAICETSLAECANEGCVTPIWRPATGECT
jgi:hypothetical protein